MLLKNNKKTMAAKFLGKLFKSSSIEWPATYIRHIFYFEWQLLTYTEGPFSTKS